MEIREHSINRGVKLTLFFTIIGILFLANFGFGEEASQEKVNLLIIDETRTFEESMRVEITARLILQTGLFKLSSMLAVPQGLNPKEEKYDLILMIPGRIKQVWIITSDIPARLPERLQEAVEALRKVATQVFNPGREVVDVSQDLAPAIYGALFLNYGWLIPNSNPISPCSSSSELGQRGKGGRDR